MARSLSELASDLRKMAKELPDRANAVKQNVARTVNFDLLQVTPVDEGVAVSNWQVQNESPGEEQRAAFVPSPGGRMKDGVWVHRVDPETTRQANIEPALRIANETIDAAKPGEPIHITNVLPYIQALDEGHSAQAANFVQRAIILGNDVASRAKLGNEV